MSSNVSPGVPPIEVSSKPKRRLFTAAYKRSVLQQVDACGSGEIGALLRREGLYSSHLMEWRAARKRGELEALAPKKRGPVPVLPDARDERLAHLERQVAYLSARAERAEALVALQKKMAELFGQTLAEPSEKS